MFDSRPIVRGQYSVPQLIHTQLNLRYGVGIFGQALLGHTDVLPYFTFMELSGPPAYLVFQGLGWMVSRNNCRICQKFYII